MLSCSPITSDRNVSDRWSLHRSNNLSVKGQIKFKLIWPYEKLNTRPYTLLKVAVPAIFFINSIGFLFRDLKSTMILYIEIDKIVLV